MIRMAWEQDRVAKTSECAKKISAICCERTRGDTYRGYGHVEWKIVDAYSRRLLLWLALNWQPRLGSYGIDERGLKQDHRMSVPQIPATSGLVDRCPALTLYFQFDCSNFQPICWQVYLSFTATVNTTLHNCTIYYCKRWWRQMIDDIIKWLLVT